MSETIFDKGGLKVTSFARQQRSVPGVATFSSIAQALQFTPYSNGYAQLDLEDVERLGLKIMAWVADERRRRVISKGAKS